MGIGGMANTVQADAPQLQHTPNLAREKFQFGRGQGHAKEHVGVTGIQRAVREGQAFADIVPPDIDPRGKLLRQRFIPNAVETGLRIIQGVYVKAVPGKIEGVPALPGAELQYFMHTGPAKKLHGLYSGIARCFAEHLRGRGVGFFPVRILFVEGT